MDSGNFCRQAWGCSKYQITHWQTIKLWNCIARTTILEDHITHGVKQDQLI